VYITRGGSRAAQAPGPLSTSLQTARSSPQPYSAVVLDSRAPRAQLLGLPAGDAGVAKTLAIMQKCARDAVRAPNQYARLKALEIYKNAGLGPKQYAQEVRALQSFVQNCIRYVRDPVDVELVQTPEVTLKLSTGDCDDQSTLLAALLDSTGHEARFVAVGIDGGPFSHVLVETKIGEKWVPAETILKKPLGWYPPGVTSRLVRSV
jgi:hypothetical protein